MNRYIYLLSLILFSLNNISAQSPDRKAISSAGGSFTNNNISVSWTLGETFSSSLSNPNFILSQGFQQTYFSKINVKLFIEGYYIGNNKMTPVLYNQGVQSADSNQVDTVSISLLDTTNLEEAYTTKGILDVYGNLDLKIPEKYLGKYFYCKISHRNSLITYTKNPILINTKTIVDFTIIDSNNSSNKLINSKINSSHKLNNQEE